ncbi:MAG: ABC transporter substrate-binding protein, partial [Deltaproteobacteria bacterium]
GKVLSATDFGLHPIGTGPFRFREWKDDGTIILEADHDYHEGRPCLDKIVVKTYPDSERLWLALMRGEVDCVEFINRRDYEILKEDPTFKAYAFAVDGYYALRYVLSDPVVSDKRIREALERAIDADFLIRRVEGGYGVPASGPFWPGSLGFSPDMKAPAYDPEKARALLREAGWQDSNKDGIFDKDGRDLELRVLFDERYGTYEKLVMALRQQLQEAGIKLKAAAYRDDSSLTEDFFRENGIQVVLTFLFGGGDPDQEAEDWSPAASEKVKRLWGYDDPEVDRLFGRGRVTQDQEERRKIYQEIGRRIAADKPACFLYYPYVFHGIASRFEGTDAYFCVNMPNYLIKDFHSERQQN